MKPDLLSILSLNYEQRFFSPRSFDVRQFPSRRHPVLALRQDVHDISYSCPQRLLIGDRQAAISQDKEATLPPHLQGSNRLRRAGEVVNDPLVPAQLSPHAP
jgi:hypothetical protein